MMNEFKPTINLTRANICDLLLACLAAESISDGQMELKNGVNYMRN